MRALHKQRVSMVYRGAVHNFGQRLIAVGTGNNLSERLLSLHTAYRATNRGGQHHARAQIDKPLRRYALPGLISLVPQVLRPIRL